MLDLWDYLKSSGVHHGAQDSPKCRDPRNAARRIDELNEEDFQCSPIEFKLLKEKESIKLEINEFDMPSSPDMRVHLLDIQGLWRFEKGHNNSFCRRKRIHLHGSDGSFNSFGDVGTIDSLPNLRVQFLRNGKLPPARKHVQFSAHSSRQTGGQIAALFRPNFDRGWGVYS